MADKSPGLSLAAQPALLANLVRAIRSFNDMFTSSDVESRIEDYGKSASLGFGLNFGPGVLQGGGAVPDHLLRRGIFAVDAEVALAHELAMVANFFAG